MDTRGPNLDAKAAACRKLACQKRLMARKLDVGPVRRGMLKHAAHLERLMKLFEAQANAH
jgi:hypothetical protein